MIVPPHELLLPSFAPPIDLCSPLPPFRSPLAWTPGRRSPPPRNKRRPQATGRVCCISPPSFLPLLPVHKRALIHCNDFRSRINTFGPAANAQCTTSTCLKTKGLLSLSLSLLLSRGAYPRSQKEYYSSGKHTLISPARPAAAARRRRRRCHCRRPHRRRPRRRQTRPRAPSRPSRT